MAGTGTNIPARCRVFMGSRSKTNLSRYEVRDSFQVDPVLAQRIGALIQVRSRCHHQFGRMARATLSEL